ncbi:MAG: polysaccharide biosynthesis tyrosine autokinase [Planctomycetota bacterium]
MGYIFDALNKAGEQPEPDKPDHESTGQDAAHDTTDPCPLRLEQIIAKHEQKPQDGSSSEMEQDAGVDARDTEPVSQQGDGEPLKMAGLEGPSQIESPDGVEPIEQPVIPQAPATAQAEEDASPFRLPGVVDSKRPRRSWYQFWMRPTQTLLDDRLVVLTGAASSMAEEYRSIRTSILARHQSERHLVHTITSATPQEGKTITCMNLGLAFAELRNRKTVVVECDLRLPTFEKLLQLDHPTGLISYLHGDADLKQIVTQVPGTGLDVITAGGRVSDEAVQMLSSTRMSRLIQSLRAKYDHVIIDTPPVVDLADAGILGAQGDEVLLVARMRRTPQQLVEQAVRTLSSYNAQVAGVIATDNPRTRGRGYGYRYGYGYGYRYTYSGKRRGRRYAA